MGKVLVGKQDNCLRNMTKALIWPLNSASDLTNKSMEIS